MDKCGYCTNNLLQTLEINYSSFEVFGFLTKINLCLIIITLYTTPLPPLAVLESPSEIIR